MLHDKLTNMFGRLDLHKNKATQVSLHTYTRTILNKSCIETFNQ